MRSLTDKQQAFVDHYLTKLNATEAAKAAGYSKKTAKSMGYENLTKPHIKAAIAEGRKKQQKRVEITQDMVVEGLLKEAQREDNASHSARVQAWKALGKHLAMFTDRSEVDFKGGPQVIVKYPDPEDLPEPDDVSAEDNG
jgi:phage terminase small subunit